MNMPKVDTYGTQQPITFLLTLISRGFFFDREKDLTHKVLKDVSYTAAMGPPGGGRNNVDPRFISLFAVCNLPEPTSQVLGHIYSSIFETRLRDFPQAVRETATRFPAFLLSLFSHIVETLPPTPSKFFYLFTLRDLSRVAEGVCLATEDAFNDGASVARLLRNEIKRVFCDRLITSHDVEVVDHKIAELVATHFPADTNKVLADPLVFGDYKHAVRRLADQAEDARIYQDFGPDGMVETKDIFDAVIEQYNAHFDKALTLVLFEQALEHATRIYRIIRMPRGNALLVGVGGSGKQSLAKLATFCAGYELFCISLVRNYGEAEFKEDLKKLYAILGEREVAFLFADSHVADEGFLESLNNMLTTGMVPALYEQDEKDALCNSVRKEAKEQGIIDTPDNLWKFYVRKCQNNLHIVLAMSPSGEKLRLRCRSFPGN